MNGTDNSPNSQPATAEQRPAEPSQLTALNEPSTTSHPASSSASSSTTGLSQWEQTRAQWTRGHRPYSPNPPPAPDWYKSNPALADVDVTHFDAIYKSLVEGRRFAKPVPLPFVVAVLIHGWKVEGLWNPATGIGAAYPADESNNNNKNNNR
ncbi:uncharacterized protein SPPG_04824 [Spizellomyces punctatus DAOM BR117]|uniref:Gag1-like clamp domain-containing protein n=1 Tax=Spizellomyces punctatus (strain DAOM BR117) TaxID=645134 RepID=A0A0L0HHF7_SPIPD|nr:uncharacterized protein SPPG_04824 [Spizellomyces punctatus DAOM BR117]KND00512.1 hypothetical protein SPPG_04824 [Spizellomyces punctatus DAOM BR117]|eukprot:XP_016608551.1 hypothetical protein SPPG_04824 [Spizellomyces punctatus DAOM BR117]